MKMNANDFINAKISNSMFRSYDSNILYRTTTNYHTTTYYRKTFNQKQYNIAKNVVIDDLHTIVDKIFDFTN